MTNNGEIIYSSIEARRDIGKQKNQGSPLGRIDIFINLFLSVWKKELSLRAIMTRILNGIRFRFKVRASPPLEEDGGGHFGLAVRATFTG